MKYLVVFLLIFKYSNALSQEFIDKSMEQLQLMSLECATELHVTSDDLAELVAGETFKRYGVKCLIFCVQKKLHLMKEDGTIDKVGSMLALDSLRDDDFETYKKVLEIFINCGDKAIIHDDSCETGTSLALCARNGIRAIGLSDAVLG